MCYNYAASCGKDHNQKFRWDKSLFMSTMPKKRPIECSKLNVAKNQKQYVVPQRKCSPIKTKKKSQKKSSEYHCNGLS